MQGILKTVRQAVQMYNMISDGDKIAVGVSGGKDSLVLLSALHLLSKFYPKKFSVIGVTVDQCFDGEDGDHSAIQSFFREREIEYTVEKTQIWEIVFKVRKEQNPCSLCSRMRKGALYDAARRLGCNKVALGHSLDDAAVTFYMNLLNNGTLSCFSPVTELSDKGITVIRPLVLTDERDIIHAAEADNLPVIKSRCPVNGITDRARIREEISALDKRHKGIKEKTIGAMQRAHLCGW